MQRFLFLFSFLFFFAPSAKSQVNYTANDVVTPYNQPFRPGVNTDFIPGWDNFKLADIAAGNPSLGVDGVGAKAIRPGMFEVVFDFWGYQINRDLFEYYEGLGMEEMTALVDFPSDAHRDPVRYCANDPSIPSSLWANMYDPIWDGGLNGTPVNDNNYYALFLYKIVTAYKDNVRFWEIMNEPGFDFTGYSGWQQPGVPGNWWDNDPQPCDYKLHAPIEHYVRALRISWEIIKTYDPDSYVLASGLGYPAFLDAVLRNTDNPNGGGVTPEYPLYGGAYFDAVGFHSYPHFDGSLWATGQQRRNSDGAANGVVFKRDEFQQVLTNRGYNGNPYPRKHWLITEINTPRKNIQAQYLTEDEGQRNFIIKAIVNSKKHDIKQFHVFSLSDQKTEADATYEFDLFGLYKRLHEEAHYEQKPNSEAHAMRTASDILYETTYDAARTAALNLPANVLGGAFRNADGSFVYCLWAEALQDLSETASKTYTFPLSLGISSVQKRNWDYSITNATQTISASNIALTAAPIFLSPSFQQPICNLLVTESNKICSNAGTLDLEYDDTYSFDILVSGGSGTGWSAVINGQTFTGQHGVTKTVGPFLIFNGITDFLVKDNANPNCTARVTAGSPLPCSYSNFPNTYCSASGSGNQAWIGKFSFGNINKASGNNGYSDFTSDINSQSRVLQGAGFPVYLTSKYTSNTAPQAQYWKIWLDYNHDGVFDDATETGYEGITPVQAFGTTAAHMAGTVNVPTTLQPGPMRMRVAMRQGGYPSPCGNIGTGEVEDYLLIADNRGGQACTLYPTVTTQCLDQGNGNGTDDQVRINLQVAGWNTGGAWIANGSGISRAGRYGEIQSFNMPATAAPWTLTIKDESLGTCTETITINAPAGCGVAGPACAVSALANNIQCNNNGTPNTATDDTYSFVLTANGSNTGNNGWVATINGQTQTGQYGVAKTLSGYAISNGNLNFTLRDAQNNTCQTTVNVQAPAPCSVPACAVSAFVTNIQCNNNGTPNTATDDTYSFVLTANGSNTGNNGWVATINGQTQTGQYGVAKTLSGYVISNGNLNFTLRDAQNNTCQTTVNVQAPAPCSVPACALSAVTSSVTCNNNGTGTTSLDDYFSFNLLVNGSNTGNQGWTATINGQTQTGQYGVAKSLSGYLISSGNLNFTVRDAQNNTCSQAMTVQAPPTCSGVGPGPPPQTCPSTSTFPWHDWIANVKVGTIDNASSKSTYSNFMSQNTSLTPGSSTPISLTTGFSWVTFDSYWKVWIDANRNGVFEEPGEVVFQQIGQAPPNGTTSKTVNGALNLPVNAQQGGAKMRVSMKRGSYASPCETLPEGEVEDYTINIGSGGGNTCSITAATSNVLCNNNGTNSNPSDDRFSFSLTVNGTNTGTNGWTASINGQTQTGQYGVAKTLSGYLIAAGNLSFTVRDAQNAACQASVNVQAPAACSTGGGGNGIDLELSISSINPNPGIWKVAEFTLTVENKGTQTANGVMVRILPESDPVLNARMVHTSNTVTAGTSYNFWSGNWNIGTIPAGQSHTLTFVGFTKTNSGIPVFAQVTAHSPTDTDSSPNNNTSGTPNEDDEVLLVLNGTQPLIQGDNAHLNTSATQTAADEVTGVLVYPNPTAHKIRVEWLNGMATVTLGTAQGLVLHTETAFDALELDLSNQKEGLYFVRIEVSGKRTVTKKVVVVR